MPVDTSRSSDADVDNRKTPYEQLLWNMQYDTKWLKDMSLGKRMGLYRFSETLGSGNFSHVKLAVHQLTRDKVAIKIIDKTKLDYKTRKMIAQEIATMEAVHHPNIIRLFEVIETYRKIHLVTEYAGGGELFTKVTMEGRLAALMARHLFLQVAQAVRHMHMLGFVHRDIKAENVLFSAPAVVKLGDFGFSTRMPTEEGTSLNTFCGSPPYAAPELFRAEQYAGEPVDAWALAVLLYFMLAAALPFRAPDLPRLRRAVLTGQYQMPAHLPPRASYIIEKTLLQQPNQRLTISEIIDDEWFKVVPKETNRLRKSSLTFLAKRFRKGTPSNPTRRRLSSKEDALSTIREAGKDTGSKGVKINNFTEGGMMRTTQAHSIDLGALPSSRASLLRRADGSPAELGRFVLWPSAPGGDLPVLEVRTRERLRAYGLGESELADALAAGSRSPVLGVYRVVLHRLLQEECVWCGPDVPGFAVPAPPRPPPPKQVRSKISRVCTLL